MGCEVQMEDGIRPRCQFQTPPYLSREDSKYRKIGLVLYIHPFWMTTLHKIAFPHPLKVSQAWASSAGDKLGKACPPYGVPSQSIRRNYI